MSGTILVTGASGGLGRAIVAGLLTRVSARRVSAMCRNPSDLDDLARLGVDVRAGDYTDPRSLEAALAGVEKLMLVSAPAFTDAVRAHHNVIAAARRVGVAHLHFSSIQRKPDSQFTIAQVTEWDRAAEMELADTGLAVTILRNTLYTEALDDLIGQPDERGRIRVPAGRGRAAVATRTDIAEATAAVLAGDGHEGQIYDLAGSHPVTLDEIAAVIATAYGRVVTYQPVDIDDFIAERIPTGTRRDVLRFQADWFAAIATGQFAATGMVQDLLGHPPTDPLSFVSRRRRCGEERRP